MAKFEVDGKVIARKERSTVLPGTQFSRLVWEDSAGKQHEYSAIYVTDPLIDRVSEGTEGRYLIGKGVFGRQVYGYIGPTGDHRFDWWTGGRVMGFALVVIGLAICTFRFLMGDGFFGLSFIGALLGVGMVVVDIFEMQKARKEFDADASKGSAVAPAGKL